MRRLLLSLAFFSSLFSFSTFAQESEAHDLFRQLWSPYCKGISLLECTSSQAAVLRDELKARFAAGETKEQILKDIQARYGDRLRMVPDGSGREGLAWRLPWIATFAVLIGIFIWALRRKRPGVVPAPARGSPVNREIEDKILKDLSERT